MIAASNPEADVGLLLHPGCCSSPRSASEINWIKKHTTTKNTCISKSMVKHRKSDKFSLLNMIKFYSILSFPLICVLYFLRNLFFSCYYFHKSVSYQWRWQNNICPEIIFLCDIRIRVKPSLWSITLYLHFSQPPSTISVRLIKRFEKIFRLQQQRCIIHYISYC